MYFEKPSLNYELPAKKTGLTNEPHIHSNVELIYAEKGSFKAVVNETEYLVQEGDVFFAFPNQTHSYCNIGDFECTIVKFNPIICGGMGDIINKTVPKTNVIHLSENSDILFYLRKLEENDNSYLEFMIPAYFTLISAQLLFSVEFVEEKFDYNDILFLLMDYCTKNFKKDLSLDKLSLDLNVSKYYISRIFSEKICMNFKDYINSLRIKEAMHLLKTTNLTVDRIAFEVGFSSYRTFNRLFKEETGYTPSQFRKR